jgi:hypothetical protein
MNIKVEEQHLINWKKETEVTFSASFGKGSNKRLNCDLNGTYKVYDQSKIILLTNNSKQAVDTYNNLP